MTVFLIRFQNNGMLSKAIVLAENNIEASNILKKDYEKYGINIKIEEYEILSEKGIALTWHEPLI